MIHYAMTRENGEIAQTGNAPDIPSLAHLAAMTGLTPRPMQDGISSATHYWDGTAFVQFPPKPGDWAIWAGTEWIDPRTAADLDAELVAARAAAVRAINTARGNARALFITTLPGQDMVYLEKEREAREWVAARASGGNAPDPADFPHILSEVGATAPDMDSVAQVYLNMAAMFRPISAVIEGETMTALNEVDATTTPEAATAVATAFPARLMSALRGAGAIS